MGCIRLEEMAGRVGRHLGADRGAKVAVLFGSEKTGLSNEELSYCHELMTIPMNPLPSADGGKHLSMNLGQAAAICLYRLGLEGVAAGVAEEGVGAAAGDLERVTGLLREVMEKSGYARRHPANAREVVVRRLVRRMGCGRRMQAFGRGCCGRWCMGSRRPRSDAEDADKAGNGRGRPQKTQRRACGGGM